MYGLAFYIVTIFGACYAAPTLQSSLISGQISYPNQVVPRFSPDPLPVCTMPFVKLGDKNYVFETYFKANWFQAYRYCRYLGLSLAAVLSAEQDNFIIKYLNDTGFGHESFWISGTDLGSEGDFYWMHNAAKFAYRNWHNGQPDNAQGNDGHTENCVHYWNRKGDMKWNDAPCHHPKYFICEECSKL